MTFSPFVRDELIKMIDGLDFTLPYFRFILQITRNFNPLSAVWARDYLLGTCQA
jgi:hypothetical protein